MNTRTIIAIIAMCLAMTTGATTGRSQGILMPEPRPIPGPLPPRPIPRPIFVQPFFVKNLRVSTTINDAVAETTVEQTFVNDSSIAQEGTYLYPLPAGASPTSFSMTVGDKTMEPRILPRDEANAIYQGYVRRYRDPALLEYVDHSLVKISVYPIPPHGERLIRLRYTEVLKPVSGLRKYVYPLSTSRFGSKPVGTATVSIKLQTSSPIRNVYSPSHDLSVRHNEDRMATASWEGLNDASDRDLTLLFSTSSDDVGLSLMTYKSGDRDGYFMLLAAPRVNIPENRILAKQIVFVLDRTGSMQGKKIEQARKSLLFCLSNLRPQDRFDVITFNESPDILTHQLQPATQENVAKARRFVENIEASGGTNIDEALRAALGLLRTADGPGKMVVFLTDGLPTVGETNIKTILEHVKQLNGTAAPTSRDGHIRTATTPSGQALPAAGARIFCFGLGYDVNVPFLDSLADLGRAESDYVKPEEDVEATVSAFFTKVAAPVLSDVRLSFDGIDAYDVFPKVLPDLFKGSQLVVTGRFRGAGSGTVRLAGQAGGSMEAFNLTARVAEADGSNTYVPRIWAQRKLGYLIDQLRLSTTTAASRELTDEVVRISKEYGIITEYTSFLVDEQEQVRLGLRGPGAGGANLQDLLSPSNEPRVREELQRRAVQFGFSGEAVTDQSARARDLKYSNQAASRYQSANGSVLYQSNASMGKGTAVGLAAPGNFRYNQAGGGFGGGRGGLGAKGDDARQLADRGNTINIQAIGDRTFTLQANNVWQDGTFDPNKQQVTRILAFSDAHFALMRSVPQLAAFSSVGEHVIIRIGRNAVEIGDTGKERLTDSEISTLTAR